MSLDYVAWLHLMAPMDSSKILPHFFCHSFLYKKKLALLEDDLKNKNGPENYKVYISFILIIGVSSSIENCCLGEYCSKNVAGNITALRIIKCSGNNFISPACQNGNSFLLSFYYIFMWVISRVAKRQIQSRIWIKA